MRDEAEETPIVWSSASGGYWAVGGYEECDKVMQMPEVSRTRE